MRETGSILALILILLLAGYLGIAGYMALRMEIMASSPGAELNDPVVVDGLEFRNRTQSAVHASQQWLENWCPFMRTTPHLAILAITCAALGALGAMVRAVYER
ncbi:MAG TPA: hypothetical protein PLH93_09775, partial [Flavobacteriales bacterium]|nr:hypothetical protein [Flavobacteriales bacterium]